MPTSWTNLPKPASATLLAGSPMGLLLALTYATTVPGATVWYNVTKPSNTTWSNITKP